MTYGHTRADCAEAERLGFALLARDLLYGAEFGRFDRDRILAELTEFQLTGTERR